MDKVQNISTLKSRKSPKLTDRKNTGYDLKMVKNSIVTGISMEAKAKFFELMNVFSEMFFKNERDIGQCDVTAHKIQVELRSQPVKFQNCRIPLHYREKLQKKLTSFSKRNL